MGHLAPKFKNKQINKMGTWRKIGLQLKPNMDYIYFENQYGLYLDFESTSTSKYGFYLELKRRSIKYGILFRILEDDLC